VVADSNPVGSEGNIRTTTAYSVIATGFHLRLLSDKWEPLTYLVH
jgi:hypothetical protein